MTIKTLLVHLDHDDPSARLDLAVWLARRHDARLVGLFAERSRAHTVGVVAHWPTPSYRAAASESRTRFEAATAGLRAQWRDADRGGAAAVIRAVGTAAHAADLVILAQDAGDGQHHAAAPTGMAEQVVLNAGRPALVIPGSGRFTQVGRRPLIAWNNSREAARAVRDSLPLIRGADEAAVVSFAGKDGAGKDGAGKDGGHSDGGTADCLAYLADHGITARAERLVVEGVGVMDMLLSRVSDCGADLLVMGGHGHYAFPHLPRGNGARHVLTHMTVPVLMSN